jgi:hypothetical protein
MWTVRLRYSGLGMFLLVLAGALLFAWLRLSHVVFMAAAFSAAFVVGLLAATWNTWQQTTPSSLTSRGIAPDDRNLPVYDPGLRREWAPLVPPAVSRRLSGKRILHRPGPPPAQRRPTTFPAAPKAVPAPKVVPARANSAKARPATGARPARSGQGRKRNESLRPDATVDFASERRAADIDDVFAALDSQLVVPYAGDGERAQQPRGDPRRVQGPDGKVLRVQPGHEVAHRASPGFP